MSTSLDLILDEELALGDGDPDVIHLFCIYCYPVGEFTYCGIAASEEDDILPEETGDGTPEDCPLCWSAAEDHDCFG